MKKGVVEYLSERINRLVTDIMVEDQEEFEDMPSILAWAISESIHRKRECRRRFVRGNIMNAM